MTTFDLKAFQEKRDNAVEKNWFWECTPDEIVRAYRAGERKFPRVILCGADLSGTKLSGADLSEADLRGAKLSGAKLSGAKLSGADLRGAKLFGAKLSGADLRGAELSGADLRDAELSEAILSGTRGISLSMAGYHRRIVFAYFSENKLRIQAGCRNGTVEELGAAVKQDYANDPWGYQDYMNAIEFLNRWGEIELRRQQEDNHAAD